MRKTLTNIGNSLGLIIERPVLELLNIDKDTQLDVSTDGDALIIRPVRAEIGDKRARVKASAAKLMKAHHETMKKLAK